MCTTDGGLDEIGGEEDDEEFRVINDDTNGNNLSNNSKWTTRVFAAECVRKIIITSPYITNETGPG
jgi:hypothetical protein